MAFDPVSRTHRFAHATPREVFDVITSFGDYARIFREISHSEVLQTDGARVRARFQMPLLISISYTLDLVADREALKVDWTFVSGEVVTENVGGWALSAQGNDTLADYRVKIDMKAPVPGFVLRKIVDGLLNLSLPAMFDAIEQEVRSRQSSAKPAKP